MNHSQLVLDSDIGKKEWVWKTIVETVDGASSARRSAFQAALHEISDDEDIKTSFITFVSTSLNGGSC